MDSADFRGRSEDIHEFLVVVSSTSTGKQNDELITQKLMDCTQKKNRNSESGTLQYKSFVNAPDKFKKKKRTADIFSSDRSSCWNKAQGEF